MTASTITIHADDNRVDHDTDARLTSVLEKLVARRSIHHANIAVIAGDGARRWSAAAGPTDPDGDSLRPDTPFFVASITKRFIVTLVLQCHERAELDLDASITAYLPGEVTTGLHVRTGIDRTPAITVRHLASHTAGLPDYFDRPRSGPSLYARLAAGEDVAWTFADVVRMAREQHRPHFDPQDLSGRRQAARYSDTGFQLLIRIVETVTDRTFADLLIKRILDPVGLTHTWLPGRSEPSAATPPPSPLFAKQRRVHLPGTVESSNDLMSTTGDLIAFQRALLAGELFEDPVTVDVLTERRNRLRNVLSIRYGLGTMIFTVPRLVAPGRRRPVTLVGHSGATGTWLFHCPELDVHLAIRRRARRSRST